MKSKEALLKIESFCAYYSDEIDDALDIIVKDLEVLEHLKNLFNGYKVLENVGIEYKDMYLLCKNSDDSLIKEWLENE